MKGVILAGGKGTRLHSLTQGINKHLLPVGNYPMLYYPLYRLKQAGIEDVLIVTGQDDIDEVEGLLGSGRSLNLKVSYRGQNKAGGIAQALGLARDFAGKDQMMVILGDNMFAAGLSSIARGFSGQKEGAKILIKKVPDPERYGIVQLENGKIVSIEEKPEVPKSSFAVTGIFMYDSAVFDIIDDLTPSHRGELEITDVNQIYLARDQLDYDFLPGWWTDAGTLESYERANKWAKGLVLW